MKSQEVSCEDEKQQYESFQDATVEERERFLVGNKHDYSKAFNALRAHREFVKCLPLKAGHDHRFGRKDEGNLLGSVMGMLIDPTTKQYVTSKKNTNSRICFVMGAMVDLDNDVDLYVKATADFLFANIPRHSSERITIMLNVRSGGPTMKNETPFVLLPVISKLNDQLSVNFPERIQEFVIYPLPWWAKQVFDWVKNTILDPKTAAKLSTLAGDASFGSEEPDGLNEYIDADRIKLQEDFLQFYPSPANDILKGTHGSLERAKFNYMRTLDGYRRLYADNEYVNDVNVVNIMKQMANVLKHQNKLNESKDMFQHVLWNQEMVLSRGKSESTIQSIVSTLKSLIYLCDEMGNAMEAEKWTLKLNSTIHAAMEGREIGSV